MAEWSARFPLTQRDVKMYAPLTGGVYRLTKKVGEKHLVFYVGQTESLGRQLMAHISQREQKACIKEHAETYDCWFRFAQPRTAEEKTAAVEEAVKKYHPCCNG